MDNRTTDAPPPKKGKPRTGYDQPKSVNYRKADYDALVIWGMGQNPVMNFSDVTHLMTVEFMQAHNIRPETPGQ